MLDAHGNTLCCTKSLPHVKGNRRWCGQTGVASIKGKIRCAEHCGKAPWGWTVVARGGGQTDPAKDIIYVYKRDCPADEKHHTADLAPFTHATKALAEAAGARGEYAYKRKPLCRLLALHEQGIFDDQAVTEAEQADIADGCERCIADAPSP